VLELTLPPHVPFVDGVRSIEAALCKTNSTRSLLPVRARGVVGASPPSSWRLVSALGRWPCSKAPTPQRC
jgi:hypothetical protein